MLKLYEKQNTKNSHNWSYKYTESIHILTNILNII